MNLDEAVGNLVELGELDPLVIARKVEQRNGREWLGEELLARAEQIVAEIARQQLGAFRRSAEVALRPGDEMSQAEMKIAKVWVPEEGWKVAANLTVEDLIAKAVWYERLMSAAGMRAQWLREVAGMMVEDGVKKLGGLKRPLPPLAGIDELEAA